MAAFDTFLAALCDATSLDGVLGDERVEYPPNEHVDYWATPQNAVVFGWMGCDGVHYAILKIDGQILDRSPVIQIGPMDFGEPYSLLAPTFADYLAIGCGVTPDEIKQVLDLQKNGTQSLVDYLRSRFQQSRFWTDGVDRDIGRYNDAIIRKPDGEQPDAPKPDLHGFPDG